MMVSSTPPNPPVLRYPVRRFPGPLRTATSCVKSLFDPQHPAVPLRFVPTFCIPYSSFPGAAHRRAVKGGFRWLNAISPTDVANFGRWGGLEPDPYPFSSLHGSNSPRVFQLLVAGTGPDMSCNNGVYVMQSSTSWFLKVGKVLPIFFLKLGQESSAP